MSVTQMDLDDDALAEVMRIAGVHTKKEAVNLAMRDYVERFRRVEALARSRDQAKGWDYEGWSPCGPMRRLSGLDLFPGGFRGLATAAATGTHRGMGCTASWRSHRFLRTTTSRVPSIGSECGRVRPDEPDFRDLYPDVPVPKSVWRWIDSAQHRLVGVGGVRALR